MSKDARNEGLELTAEGKEKFGELVACWLDMVLARRDRRGKAKRSPFLHPPGKTAGAKKPRAKNRGHDLSAGR